MIEIELIFCFIFSPFKLKIEKKRESEEGLIYGADSVYIGLPSYSMRSRSKISIEEIAEGITIAHSNNKKVYIAFNIFAKDNDFINFIDIM